jgi:hypothetical protein
VVEDCARVRRGGEEDEFEAGERHVREDLFRKSSLYSLEAILKIVQVVTVRTYIKRKRRRPAKLKAQQ